MTGDEIWFVESDAGRGTKEPCPVLSAVECSRRVPTRIIRPPSGIIDRKPLDVRGKSEE